MNLFRFGNHENNLAPQWSHDKRICTTEILYTNQRLFFSLLFRDLFFYKLGDSTVVLWKYGSPILGFHFLVLWR